jgi:hypothetical protein
MRRAFNVHGFGVRPERYRLQSMAMTRSTFRPYRSDPVFQVLSREKRLSFNYHRACNRTSYTETSFSHRGSYLWEHDSGAI